MIWRSFAWLMLLALPGSAVAGLRAVYVQSGGASTEVRIADNGDIEADWDNGRRLSVRAGRAYVIETRLTGQMIQRLEDLETVAGTVWTDVIERPDTARDGTPFPLRTVVVAGQTGTAYSWTRPSTAAAVRKLEPEPEPDLVLSTDTRLAPLAKAMRKVWDVEALLYLIDHPDEAGKAFESHAEKMRLFERGAPLRYGDTALESLEREEIRLADIDLAAAAEPLAALRNRIVGERRESESESENPSGASDISRAVFAEGRLWLLADDGALTSLAKGEIERRAEGPGGKVLDLCLGRGGFLAVTGDKANKGRWTLWRRAGGGWRRDRPIPHAKEALVALTCAGETAILLTTARVVEVDRTRVRAVTIAGDVRMPRVKAVTHEVSDHLFVGKNSGEWGGGLIRIARATGDSVEIEHNATGSLCDGPLNTACDPVHGIVTIPWKPACVAAAIGLRHMSSHGRVVEVCGSSVRQMFAQASDRHRTAPEYLAETAAGGSGSVAFFGLASAGEFLTAVGSDGLYRLDRSGLVSHQAWPRFTKVDGLLVSFELPDAILLISTINGRASVGWSAPLLVPR